jgi:hypothetical protein
MRRLVAEQVNESLELRFPTRKLRHEQIWGIIVATVGTSPIFF